MSLGNIRLILGFYRSFLVEKRYDLLSRDIMFWNEIILSGHHEKCSGNRLVTWQVSDALVRGGTV